MDARSGPYVACKDITHPSLDPAIFLGCIIYVMPTIFSCSMSYTLTRRYIIPSSGGGKFQGISQR
jgi:hypothetical protein